MITVTVYKHSDEYKGFRCEGHAGYAQEGEDIVCAAVSVLTVNTVNSIEAFTEDAFSGEEKDGFVSCMLTGCVSEETRLLMDSMVLGLSHIKNNYDDYIQLRFKEV
ncbi:MAG: ribosomal-processing cysteine protease Prp [Lachnospiraceae bacterium]|nr:ribosomal-processing cysteine protease Prp [Lachnospiraceae bacterium]